MDKVQEMDQPTTAEPTSTTDGCASCQKAAAEAAKNEEASFAFLLALIPVITLTFFGQVGLL